MRRELANLLVDPLELGGVGFMQARPCRHRARDRGRYAQSIDHHGGDSRFEAREQHGHPDRDDGDVRQVVIVVRRHVIGEHDGKGQVATEQRREQPARETIGADDGGDTREREQRQRFDSRRHPREAFPEKRRGDQVRLEAHPHLIAHQRSRNRTVAVIQHRQHQAGSGECQQLDDGRPCPGGPRDGSDRRHRQEHAHRLDQAGHADEERRDEESTALRPLVVPQQRHDRAEAGERHQRIRLKVSAGHDAIRQEQVDGGRQSGAGGDAIRAAIDHSGIAPATQASAASARGIRMFSWPRAR